MQTSRILKFEQSFLCTCEGSRCSARLTASFPESCSSRWCSCCVSSPSTRNHACLLRSRGSFNHGRCSSKDSGQLRPLDQVSSLCQKVQQFPDYPPILNTDVPALNCERCLSNLREWREGLPLHVCQLPLHHSVAGWNTAQT